MDLKFSFGASNPLPLTTEGAGSASPGPGSSRLSLRVTLGDFPGQVVCEALSGDGVSYARAEKIAADPAALAAAVRSAIARAGAELPEPLIESVTEIELALGGAEAEVLVGLGLALGQNADPTGPISSVDEALQARTGVSAGTPIRLSR
ncbi:hypothetical protein ACFPZL_10895 [Leucobacter soli]|uniref:Uncharacterized protein n=1 Tax=Leucobacter soli TaxID=2812850 RepID=A0A916K1L8_9MICO|nr:hypothetical protein [Leucobacter soli]CAG7622771.1 hypothetical protein LEUCIP111803_02553 [Leucobacter soli]